VLPPEEAVLELQRDSQDSQERCNDEGILLWPEKKGDYGSSFREEKAGNEGQEVGGRKKGGAWWW